jgi:peroxin-10
MWKTWFRAFSVNPSLSAYELTLGSRWLHSHRPLLKAVSDALYLGLTTAIGFRTLGEEYTEIYQTSSNRKPLALRRYGYVLAESLGFYVVIQFLWPRVRRRLQRQVDEVEGQNQRREKLLKGIIAVFENISSVHLALFYFLGTYYSLPKRIFRIRYVRAVTCVVLIIDLHETVDAE